MSLSSTSPCCMKQIVCHQLYSWGWIRCIWCIWHGHSSLHWHTKQSVQGLSIPCQCVKYNLLNVVQNRIKIISIGNFSCCWYHACVCPMGTRSKGMLLEKVWSNFISVVGLQGGNITHTVISMKPLLIYYLLQLM